MKVVGIGSKAGPEERSSIKGPVPCAYSSEFSITSNRKVLNNFKDKDLITLLGFLIFAFHSVSSIYFHEWYLTLSVIIAPLKSKFHASVLT